MTAFHLPPGQGFSGTPRTVTLARDLPGLGWQPLLLAPHPRAYPACEAQSNPFPPPGVILKRAFCLDAARHLAWHGRYSRWLALPDRWSSWWPTGVFAGMGMIRRHAPVALWVTYPVATALTIALTLRRLSGLPLVVDLRDPLHLPGHPPDPRLYRHYRQLEWQALRWAARVTVTTEGTRALLLERYPDFPPDRLAVVGNGYDETAITRALERKTPRRDGEPLLLVHGGTLYTGHEERNPEVFFHALGQLAREGALPERGVRIRFRASGADALLHELIQRHGVTGLVEVAPMLDHAAMLEEMAGADGLLLLQGRRFDRQVPAKLFECFGLGKPILGLVGAGGHAAELLREAGLAATCVELHDQASMAGVVRAFLRMLDQDAAPCPDHEVIQKYGRRAMNQLMARQLDAVLEHPLPLPHGLRPLGEAPELLFTHGNHWKE